MKSWTTALLIAGLAMRALAQPSLAAAEDRDRGGYERHEGGGDRGGRAAPARPQARRPEARGYPQARQPQAPGYYERPRAAPPAWNSAPAPAYGRDPRYDYGGGYGGPPVNDTQPFYGVTPRYAPPPAMGRWRRGEYLPPAYRGYAIPDYARYHLRRPPRGYYWRRSGEDFVLVAAASGLIFEVINGDD